jgi:hypothetical protein
MFFIIGIVTAQNAILFFTFRWMQTGAAQKLQEKFWEHLANLPKEYVRKEDAIRQEVVINAKLDALYAKMDEKQKGARNERD